MEMRSQEVTPPLPNPMAEQWRFSSLRIGNLMLPFIYAGSCALKQSMHSYISDVTYTRIFSFYLPRFLEVCEMSMASLLEKAIAKNSKFPLEIIAWTTTCVVDGLAYVTNLPPPPHSCSSHSLLLWVYSTGH